MSRNETEYVSLGFGFTDRERSLMRPRSPQPNGPDLSKEERRRILITIGCVILGILFVAALILDRQFVTPWTENVERAHAAETMEVCDDACICSGLYRYENGRDSAVVDYCVRRAGV